MPRKIRPRNHQKFLRSQDIPKALRFLAELDENAKAVEFVAVIFNIPVEVIRRQTEKLRSLRATRGVVRRGKELAKLFREKKNAGHEDVSS